MHSFTIALFLIRVFSSSAIFSFSRSRQHWKTHFIRCVLLTKFHSRFMCSEMASTKYQNTEKIKPRENKNRKIAFHSHSLFVFIVSPLFHIYLKLDEVFWVVMAAVGGVAAAHADVSRALYSHFWLYNTRSLFNIQYTYLI